VVFARRRSGIRQAVVEIGDVSSGFSNFVAMAFRGDQRRQFVHRRDPLLAYEAPNADPVHDRLHLPCDRYLLSQHLPTWDEWSSPGELIHPGDLPSVSSVTSNQTKTVYRWAIRNGIRILGRDLTAILESAARCKSGSGQPLIGLPQRVVGAGGTSSAFGYPELVEADADGRHASR
jgi:hypothetical protein